MNASSDCEAASEIVGQPRDVCGEALTVGIVSPEVRGHTVFISERLVAICVTHAHQPHSIHSAELQNDNAERVS